MRHDFLSIRLFGSAARGDSDADSDIDILVVCDEYEPDLTALRSSVARRFASQPVAVSVYSRDRIAELYRQGSLFAWHLFLESKHLHGDTRGDVIDSLGCPAHYANSASDIGDLIEVGESIVGHLKLGTRATVYEAGLLYLVARNAAIVASPAILNEMIFARDAPFTISRRSGCKIALNRQDYAALCASRRASLLGGRAPKLDRSHLVSLAVTVTAWVRCLQGVGNGHAS